MRIIIGTRRILRRLVYCASIFLISPSTLSAQESVFQATLQRHAALPGNIDGLTFVDGDLYCYSSGIMLKATRYGETVTALLPDTLLAAISPEATYITRHPSGDLYLTQPDRKGRSSLMRLQQRDGRKAKLTRVKFDDMAVEHPTFTADGRVMVFASHDGRSAGGYDLWYSLYENDNWSKPVNLGNRINTKGDDFAPTIYREYLLFATTGRDNSTSLYATRLISDRVTGDTVGMLQIGRSPLQRLPEPIDMASSDDYDIAIDTLANCGYWVSNRDGKPRLYSFSGSLDGIVLWGHVKNRIGQPLEGVRITVGNSTLTTFTDANGFYRIYLVSGHNYTVRYQLDDYFSFEENITTPKGNIDYLVTETHRETTLDRLPLGQRIYYFDLFGPNADIELSNHGRNQLKPLIRFLCDNPQMNVVLSLSCNLSDDEAFNNLLTQQRIQSLQNYLYGQVPASVRLQFTGRDTSESGSAAGVSRLTAVITKR